MNEQEPYSKDESTKMLKDGRSRRKSVRDSFIDRQGLSLEKNLTYAPHCFIPARVNNKATKLGYAKLTNIHSFSPEMKV